jgi:hypothetical protein
MLDDEGWCLQYVVCDEAGKKVAVFGSGVTCG